jgi:branched-chain amino acid aminotransferase
MVSNLSWSQKSFHAVFQNNNWKVCDNAISIPPHSTCIQYAQSVIEGMKAFRLENGQIVILRIDAHYERLNKSLKRIGLPELEYSFFVAALEDLVKQDISWSTPVKSDILYMRPIVYGLDGDIFPKYMNNAGFSIYTAPVGNFMKEECILQFYDTQTRTSERGLSSSKISSNYTPILSKIEKKNSYVDVWFNPITGFIEEADTANIFFVLKNNYVITPAINDRILPGITRDSVIRIIKEFLDFPIEERDISVEEIIQLIKEDCIYDCFMTSTGIGIQHVNKIFFGDKLYTVKNSNSNTSIIRDAYSKIVFGEINKFETWRYLI